MPFGDRLAPFGIVPLRLVHVAAGSCLTAWEGHGLHTQSPTEGRCGFWFGAVTHKATWDAHAVSLSVASSPQGKCPKTHVLGCVVPIGVPQRENQQEHRGRTPEGWLPLGSWLVQVQEPARRRLQTQRSRSLMSMGDLQEEFLPLCGASLVFLSWLSTDWTRPTHVRKVNLLHSGSTDGNVSPI